MIDPKSDSSSTEWRVLLDCANPNVTLLALRPEQTSSLDWPRLLALAADQGLLPLLTQKLSHSGAGVIPADSQQGLKSFFREQTIFDLRMLAELYRILDRFAAQGIGVMVTKTLVIMGDPQLTTTPEHPRGAMFRAYDKTNGQQVGTVFMAAPQSGSPMTYLAGGKQYIVVATSGGAASGEYIAFTLPN